MEAQQNPSYTGQDRSPARSGTFPPQAAAAAVRLVARKPAVTDLPAAADARTLYRELLHGLYDAIVLTDLQGQIVEGNRRAEEFLLWSLAELPSKSISEVIMGLSPARLGRIRPHLESGRFMVMNAHCARRDACSFPAEIAISRVNLGGHGLLVFSIRSIEWRLEAEAKLQTEHNALQNAVSSIAITQADGVLEYVNPAFVRLWEKTTDQELIGHNIRTFWESQAFPEEMIAEPLAARTWLGEVVAEPRLGHPVQLQVAASPKRDASNQVVGVVLSFVDITEQRKAQSAIQKEAALQMHDASARDNFSGSLYILSLTDVLQLIESSGRSGRLTLSDDKREEIALLECRAGQVVRARCGTATGTTAFFEIMQRGGACFTFQQCEPTAQDGDIARSTTNLLLEAARYMDETH